SNSHSESTSISFGTIKNPFYGTDFGPVGKNRSTRRKDNLFLEQHQRIYLNQRNSKKEIFLLWQNGCQQWSSKETHFKKVCGIAYPGELLAILGSSGAGKSTLLNALTFRPAKSLIVTGLRCVNGVPVNSRSLTSQSAYVQQDDLFIGSLTVREHLVFQALVRMDQEISYHQRMRRVDEVIAEAPQAVSKAYPAGKKKRLSFAAEVLTNPSLLFCDEPTSGLDSFMALNVVQVLKTLAQTGKTVVCTIHQPSSELYAMFDKLLLMTDGRVAFFGNARGGVRVFCWDRVYYVRSEDRNGHKIILEAPCPRNYNPADYFIQLLGIIPEREESCRQAIAMICDKFEKSDIGVKMIVESSYRVSKHSVSRGKLLWNFSIEIRMNFIYCIPIRKTGETSSPRALNFLENDIWINGHRKKSPYKASWFAQFRVVLWRSWLSIVKEPLLVKVRLFQTMMIAFILGAIYYGQINDQEGVMNINGVLFIFLTNMTFQNVFAVINVFCTELPIFLREHRNGMYRTDVYFLSKTIAETPIFVIMPIVFTSICYYLIGLNPEMPRFFLTCAILVLVANVSTSFGYMISCVSSNISMALSVGPPLIIPFLLFGASSSTSIPIYLHWLAYLSWFKYGNEALLVNQWENVTDIKCPTVNSTCPKTGHVVLETYNFSEDNFLADIIALCCLIIGFRIVAYLSLLWKAYRED
ncbi:hypothetical protein NQ317_011566, partial [Molorchus minor]